MNIEPIDSTPVIQPICLAAPASANVDPIMAAAATFAVLHQMARAVGAASVENQAVIDVLIKYGNNPDRIPPLDYAIKVRDLAAVKTLVEHGWNVNANAMYYAVTEKDLEIMKYLYSKGAALKGELISHAARANFIEGLDFLLACKCPISSAESGSLLFQLINDVNCSGDSIRKIINYGADCTYTRMGSYKINNRKVGYEKFGLLDAAINRNDLDLAKLLVEHGAPINYCTVNLFHLHPLYRSVMEGKIEFAEYLLSKGALVSSVQKQHLEIEFSTSRGNGEINFKKQQFILRSKLLDPIQIQRLFEFYVRGANLDLIKEFYAAGVKIESRHCDKAAQGGDRKILAWLLEHLTKP